MTPLSGVTLVRMPILVGKMISGRKCAVMHRSGGGWNHQLCSDQVQVPVIEQGQGDRTGSRGAPQARTGQGVSVRCGRSIRFAGGAPIAVAVCIAIHIPAHCVQFAGRFTRDSDTDIRNSNAIFWFRVFGRRDVHGYSLSGRTPVKSRYLVPGHRIIKTDIYHKYQEEVIPEVHRPLSTIRLMGFSFLLSRSPPTVTGTGCCIQTRNQTGIHHSDRKDLSSRSGVMHPAPRRVERPNTPQVRRTAAPQLRDLKRRRGAGAPLPRTASVLPSHQAGVVTSGT